MVHASRAAAKGEAPALDLDTYIPALLVFVANRMTSTGTAAFQRFVGLGIVEFRVLAMLAVESDISAARICQVIGMDKAAVSRTLKALEARALVRVGVDRSHGRKQRIALTREGRRLHDKAILIAMERQERLLDGFSARERSLAAAFLRRMLENVPKVAALAQED